VTPVTKTVTDVITTAEPSKPTVTKQSPTLETTTNNQTETNTLVSTEVVGMKFAVVGGLDPASIPVVWLVLVSSCVVAVLFVVVDAC
jgi:hypothetical protein